MVVARTALPRWGNVSDMNSFDLQRAFNNRYDTQQRYELVVPNVYVGSCEWDLLAVRKSHYIDEIEIKISKSDFLADFKKTTFVRGNNECRPWEGYQACKHKTTASGGRKCNYFWFLLPDHLVDKCEIPEHAGLFVFKEHKTGNTVSEVKSAKLLHKNKVDIDFLYKTARKGCYRYWDTTR